MFRRVSQTTHLADDEGRLLHLNCHLLFLSSSVLLFPLKQTTPESLFPINPEPSDHFAHLRNSSPADIVGGCCSEGCTWRQDLQDDDDGDDDSGGSGGSSGSGGDKVQVAGQSLSVCRHLEGRHGC